jgi:hypothetical protein
MPRFVALLPTLLLPCAGVATAAPDLTLYVSPRGN